MALTNILYPEGNLQKIKQTATGPFDYNVQAQADLTKNVSNAISNPLIQTAFDFAAPATAGILSIPYDAMQAATRINETDVANAFNTAGMMGPRDITSEMFGTSYSRENPLTSLFGRFVGASAPLSERLSNWKDDFNTYGKAFAGDYIHSPQMRFKHQQLMNKKKQNLKNIEAKAAAEAKAKADAAAAAAKKQYSGQGAQGGGGGTNIGGGQQTSSGIAGGAISHGAARAARGSMSGWGLADGGLINFYRYGGFV